MTLWHSAPVDMETVVTAHAVTEIEFNMLEKWMPPDLDAASTGEMVERATPTELKGSTRLGHTFSLVRRGPDPVLRLSFCPAPSGHRVACRPASPSRCRVTVRSRTALVTRLLCVQAARPTAPGNGAVAQMRAPVVRRPAVGSPAAPPFRAAAPGAFPDPFATGPAHQAPMPQQHHQQQQQRQQQHQQQQQQQAVLATSSPVIRSERSWDHTMMALCNLVHDTGAP